MEPEISGFRAADQLQSGTLQDQTVPTHPARGDVAQGRNAANLSRLEMGAIRMPEGLIKGYLEAPICEDLEDLLRHAPLSTPKAFRMQRLDADVFEDIPIKDAKAVFFVKSFEGDARHHELTFHTRTVVAQGIWVRIGFKDGEVMEGLVHNSIHYLIDSGFYMLPTDPGSNNKLVYVVKNGIQDCRVLGLRTI
jgi:hypothetical protein